MISLPVNAKACFSLGDQIQKKNQAKHKKTGKEDFEEKICQKETWKSPKKAGDFCGDFRLLSLYLQQFS